VIFLVAAGNFPRIFRAIRQVSMNSAQDNINQSIDLVLRTARGERCLLPYFGSELRSFLFRQPDATLKDEIIQSVRLTLLNDEPRITVESIDVSLRQSLPWW
jgi:phage baseplate assembly protein W